MVLFLRKNRLAKSEKAIQTTFSSDRPKKVYCEECYLKAVD